ncbi:MAG: SDR family NAD(P)-dependent oxidoreductase [Rhodococcus sp.]|nr:SDR family NAD(P)-dependent oxidoreductase [Rhodococcus sp. (in: high G+C Gram-positive bacteria)]
MTGSRALAGRGAVVTGSSRGIGRAVALALAAEGAAVVVNGREADAVEAVVAEIEATGGRAIGVAGSAANEAVAERLVETCNDEFGPIDVLVNCAGVSEPAGSSILTIATDEWRQLIDAHLNTAFFTCRAAARVMAKQGRGSIVNTSSFAFLGDYGGTGYPAGKGAVNSLTMAIAAELKDSGVRANVVCPGAKTRLSEGSEYEEHIEDLHKRGMLDDATRHGSLNPAPPEYVAQLYTFLASDRGADITGQILAGSGCFLGSFERRNPTLLAYRDHDTNPPWTLDEIGDFLSRR